MFTATTSICATGLVTVSTASAWSVFGQFVIMCLIQIGGLGSITIISAIMVIINKRIGMKDRILLQDTFNLNSLFGIKGIWYSIFNSVSAFCNAGMDIIGKNSLCNYNVNPIINTVTSLLIVLGGIGRFGRIIKRCFSV